MASSQRERASVDQMDVLTRQYFIHHRNQVGINRALMDLFHLIDQFLQTDDNARNHLSALRAISDFVQQKQLVAPMSSTSFDLYDGEAAPTQRNSSQALGDLLQLFSGLQIPNELSQQPRGRPRTFSDTTTPHAPPVAANPATRSAPKNTTRNVPNDLFLKPENPHHVPYAIPENPDFEEPKDVSCIQLARDKLRSWLARPETAALKRLVGGRRRRTVSAMAETQPEILFSPIAMTIGPDSPVQSHFPPVRTTSVAYPDDLPLPYDGKGVIVVQETTTHRDSLPPTQRRRAVSFSPGAALPTPPPTRSRDMNFDQNTNSPKLVVTPPPDAMLGSSARLRKPKPRPISFVKSSEKPNERLSSAPSSYPKAISPMSSSSAKRTTMSSDTSALGAHIVQASKSPLQHAQAINTRVNAQNIRAGGVSTIQRNSELQRKKGDLPPLPVDSDDEVIDSEDEDLGEPIPRINVQPPSSAGTPQRNQTPVHTNVAPSANLRSLSPNSPSRPPAALSSSKHPNLNITNSRPHQPISSHNTHHESPSSTRQGREYHSPVASTSQADVQRSSSSRSHQAAPRRQENLSRSLSVKERAATFSPAAGGGAATILPVLTSSTQARFRNPSPQITSGDTVTSAMTVLNNEDEAAVLPLGYERRPLSSIKTPVNQNNHLPYPSPISNHTHNLSPRNPNGEVLDSDANHPVRYSPRTTRNSGHEATSWSRGVPQVVNKDRVRRLRDGDAINKSRFSSDTEASIHRANVDPIPRTNIDLRRSSIASHRNSWRAGYGSPSATSRQGEQLAEVAANRNPSVLSSNYGSDSSRQHSKLELDLVGPRNEARGDDQRGQKGNQVVFPESQGSARSHSDNLGRHYAWKTTARRGEAATTEWLIDDTLMDREKRPSL